MSLFAPKSADAVEEHRISMPGIEMSFNHTTRTVFMVDQTGGRDVVALASLEEWYKSKGWFFHCVVVSPPSPDVSKE